MRIRKQFDSVQKEGKVLNTKSTSQSDTYSCNYINDAIFCKSGETIQMTDTYDCGGFVTSGGADIWFSIPIGKRLDNVSSVTVNSISITVRTNGNYLDNVSGGFNGLVSPYSTAVYIEKMTNSVGIRVRKSSAYTNVLNNDAVGIRLHSISLTFR